MSGLLGRRQFLELLAGAAAAGIMSGLAVPAIAESEPSLGYSVNAYIQQLRRAGRIPADERTAWSVYDFTAGSKCVSINEDRPLQAASMIKPFLAQAYFFRHQENERRYPYNDLIRRKMEAMIRYSDNSAANFFINRVGSGRPAANRPHEVEQVLKRHAGSIFQQTRIVEFIPKNGRSYRNKASAHDYSRFLYAMVKYRLPYADQIQYYMGLPNRDRIQDGAVDVPSSAKLLHKTGSTAHLCGDMGVIVAEGRKGGNYPYTFIGIIQKDRRASHYGTWKRDRSNVIREVSNIVYTFMSKRYNLVA
ncbi:Beta-lactamase class A [Desulfosarcina cetonica]|uniref:serine hydrolase n=1 Tax=Desulfosarcina cetonica TaxID=90730 RepID=UPI0006CF40CC|nr:serine hydrolase [Desulfosarcina cetonica]VTR66253.1 Beta-lactamase class A [Desulfosarcina cetonica]